MRDVLGPGTMLGYCTNVHAGTTLEQTLVNLREHAVAVRQRLGVDRLGVGVWLSQPAAEATHSTAASDDASFHQHLSNLGLQAFTFNAFPYGDFHQPVVKHAVYQPDWSDPKRLAYTVHIAQILASNLAPGDEGSISTLPLGWPNGTPKHQPNLAPEPGSKPDPDPDPQPSWSSFALPLLELARRLHQIEEEHGCLIHVDLEPEPGCLLDTAEDVVRFFSDHLIPRAGDMDVTRYLRVCHDICHSAVMGEDQAQVLETYRRAGIRVGKVQVSNAVEVDFDRLAPTERTQARQELAAFAEDRYLHQTMVQTDDGRQSFFEDLPEALRSSQVAEPRGRWRVHFHVPLHVERFGLIGTTQQDIGACLDSIRPDDQIHHFESETYAWHVLPEALRVETLADGIAQELRWLISAYGQHHE